MPAASKELVTLNVSRSRSDNRDVLVVSTSDAVDIGWYDLTSDTGHPAGELFSLVIDAAGAGWRLGSRSLLVSGASALVDVMVDDNRLRVYGYDGSDLGWYDLDTSLGHPASELMDLVVQAAGRAYQVGRRSAPRTAVESELHIRQVGEKLLVNSYDGTDLGWYDLATNTSHPSSEIMHLVVEAAGLGWQVCRRTQDQLAAPVPHVHGANLLQAHMDGLLQDDARWSCHAIPVGPDADELEGWLIVGPAGAFLACATGHMSDTHSTAAIEATDGLSAGEMQDALQLADQLAAHLSAAARFPVPVPLVVASFGATVLPQPGDAHAIFFLRGDCLPQWLRARREVLDDAQLQAVAEHAALAVKQFGSSSA